MDLHLRTLEALDWSVILERLAYHAHTLAGARQARQPSFAENATACRRRYAEVKEVREFQNDNETIPVGAVGDIRGMIERCGQGGVLDGPDLLSVGVGLRALVELRRWLWDRRDQAPLLWGEAEAISVETELLELLEKAFDSSGELSGTTFPALGTLRQRVRSLREKIRSTLDDILRGPEFVGILQERFVTERGGRFVVPVRASYARGLGIVHDRSRSGETAYVEPGAVVEAQNELGEAEAELLAEERRILAVLSRMVGGFMLPLGRSLDAAVHIDLAVARSELGDELHGCIPTVGEEGVLILEQGRHPVLALRGIAVVPNDLRLDSSHPGLVLTGPNTGGKTVALKLLGLAAWMVRAGIPVPAGESSRVDFFEPILADIGDLQTVSGDLSTFSGHIMVVRQVLETARPGALVLLDEIAVGTDPAQGAALARSVMETVLAKGARLVVTTHYTELKVLPLTDTRFAVAAVQYVEGRPTWRVQYGLPGSSHALAIAGRLGLEASVLSRARDLLDLASRSIDEAMERLEDQQGAVQQREAALMAQAAEQAKQVRQLENREKQLAERVRNLEKDMLDKFKQRLRAQEDEVRALVARLQANPVMGEATAALETIRAQRMGLSLQAAPEVQAPAAPMRVTVGDKVLLRGVTSPAEVLTVSGERVEVRVGALRMWGSLQDISPLTKGEVRKADRKIRAQTQKIEDRAAAPAPRVRTQSNTCDLRGQRLEDALSLTESFLDQMVLQGYPVAFLLHGHGTGALKQGLRGWLPRCKLARKWQAADPDEGGDAYTLVEL